MMADSHGNLLTADAQALVNTVNTVGVMGKGVALQFRQAFPENYRAYEAACRRGEVELGRMFVTETGRMTNPRYIINFPTKGHWKARSRLTDIAAGLDDLRRTLAALDIHSVALPALGCGNGGLNWLEVRPLIERSLGDLESVDVLVFPPFGAPPADKQPIATRRPRMTPGRAVLIGLLDRYLIEPGESASLLEIQKLLYLLQESGEDLNLRFARAKYGPYADNINHVLLALEGHFLRGFGDRSSNARPQMRVLPDGLEDARAYLESHPATVERLERLTNLIEGFESPYGLELLATTHWVATREPGLAGDVDAVAERVKSWSRRKKLLFGDNHIVVAWQRLRDLQWIPAGDAVVSQ